MKICIKLNENMCNERFDRKCDLYFASSVIYRLVVFNMKGKLYNE